MSKLNKMASKDAHRFARAEMFFGEGAGTRRKLLDAEINEKCIRIPGYSEALTKYYNRQNMADHAIAAAKHRKRLDRGKALNRTRRQMFGNTTYLTYAVVGAYYIHQSGVDKMLYDEAKVRYASTKARVKRFTKRAKTESEKDNPSVSNLFGDES